MPIPSFARLVVWIVVAVSSFSPAAEFVPSQQMAMGHSLTGASQLNDSLYSNPAASSFTTVYAVDGAMLLEPRSFSVSILDTKTSPVGGAIGYFRRPVGELSELMHGAKVALSGRVSNVIGIGIGGKMIWGPNAQGAKDRCTDLDTGILVNFGFLQLGMAVKNVAGGNKEMDQLREMSLGGRLSYMDTLSLSVAAISTWDNPIPYQYGIGAEYVSPYYFSLKGGFRFLPERRLSYWSAGASFLSPNFSLHYSAQFPRQGSEKIEHIFGTTILL